TLSSVNLGVVLTLFAPAYNVVSQNHAVELVFGKALRQVYVEAGRLRLKGEKERAVVLQECGTAIAKDAHAFFCLSSRERKVGIKNFQKMSRTRIYAASEVGKKDAGVKKVVGNLLLAVAGLGIFYGVAVGVHYKRTKCVGFFARKSLPEPLRDVHRVVGELSKSIPRRVAEDRTVVPVSRCV
ncbi:MAG: hypothetical protein KAS93_00680, partial [Gammaproteobacteria bacterium]|nr:hypothetical protein [Gammaproteobacteria bacterium]